jgi:hypothetical protein
MGLDEPMSANQNGSLSAIEPLFICLGVPKAATTWIHRQLEAHPDVATTHSKELNYWSSNHAAGPEWYVDHFPRDRRYDVYAEVAVGYLREPVIHRLADEVPSARFMVSLRNPYERSWSSYWQSTRNGEVRGTLRDAVEALPKIINDSLYSPGLAAYRERLPVDHLHVVLYDDLLQDPHAFISGIYAFAGVDPEFVPPDLEQRVNQGRQHSLADEALARGQTIAKRLGLTRGHLVKLKLWTIVDRTYTQLAKNRPLPSMTAEEWDLLDLHLRPEVRRLETLTGRDLGAWLVRPE